MWLGATKRSLGEVAKKRTAAAQGWRCAQCQQLLPATFQVDHVVPLAVGGSNDAHNLAALCPGCHAEKTQLEDERVRDFLVAARRCAGTTAAPCWNCGTVNSTYFKHHCGAGRGSHASD